MARTAAMAMSRYGEIITDSPRTARCWARRRPRGRLDLTRVLTPRRYTPPDRCLLALFAAPFDSQSAHVNSPSDTPRASPYAAGAVGGNAIISPCSFIPCPGQRLPPHACYY